MRLLHLLAAELLIAIGLPGVRAEPLQPATLKKAELERRFLLQVNYELRSGRQDFRTSRSRTVIFQRAGAVLHMLDLSDPRDGSATHIVATIPIRHETGSSLDVDLNEGFDRVYSEEDRTGEDYYGRIDRHDQTTLRLFDRKVVSVSYHER